ncbi:MAG: HD domain-containing protein [Magnetococcus sp. WYHC-3]
MRGDASLLLLLQERLAPDDPLFVAAVDLWVRYQADRADRLINDRLLRALVRQVVASERSVQKLLAENESQRQHIAEHAQQLELRVAERTADLLRARTGLETLVALGLEISRMAQPDALMDCLVHGGCTLTFAEAATLYTLGDDGQLVFARRTRKDALPAASIPLRDPVTGLPNDHFMVVRTALEGRTLAIPESPSQGGEALPAGTRWFNESSGYTTHSLLSVPLKNRLGRVTGVLQLLNARSPRDGSPSIFDRDSTGLVEALCSLGALALENMALVQSRTALFDAIIHVLASAIDAKSPYTSGHCERVPVVGRMLAEAACASQDSPFADFSLDENGWEVFRLAAWMHDSGKVTTPEHVVDKATKLETIHNRIHEVRMRFEILRRDEELAVLRARLAGDPQAAALESALPEKLEQLERDFAFVAECNIGGEFMGPERQQRLRQIAARPWVRHYDDRLGLGHLELARLEKIPRAPLPAVEFLLDDKLEHLHPYHEGAKEDGYESYGFGRSTKENCFNTGEVYNLMIPRGTLTAEEREIINDHVRQTIIMLDRLPFPAELKDVVVVAGSHHETMKGTGYPWNRQGQEIPLTGRILALADVFEALTAADRPYKKAKTLSQALDIMARMRDDGHIDPDLFDLFIRRDIPRRFAAVYLRPEQVDDFDPERLLRHP